MGDGEPALLGQPRPGAAVEAGGLVLDLGRRVHPFLTPDDPDAVEAAIRERTGLGPSQTGRGPVV